MSDYLSLRTRCTSILSSSSILSNIPGSRPGAPGAAQEEAHADLPDMGGCPLAIGARIWQEAAGTAESERCVWACLDRVQIDAEGESAVRASARVVRPTARTHKTPARGLRAPLPHLVPRRYLRRAHHRPRAPLARPAHGGRQDDA